MLTRVVPLIGEALNKRAHGKIRFRAGKRRNGAVILLKLALFGTAALAAVALVGIARKD